MGKKALKLGTVGKTCAKILRDHAADHGITNVYVATEVELSEATISRIFTGLRPMTVDELDAIADAVGLVGWQVLREAEQQELPDNVVELNAHGAPKGAAALRPGYRADEEEL